MSSGFAVGFLTDLTVSAIRAGLKDYVAGKLSLVKLGVAAAGLGIAFVAFKEARIAFRSMPDEHSLSHGGEIVAKVLQAHGVKHIFTLIGGHISPILVASKNLGITVVDFRHEVNCVFAADAMSRLTGITGVAAVTAGPGVTNTITAVKNAQMAQSPLVLIGGAAPTILKGRGSLQDVDQLSILRSLCKYSASVSSLLDLAPTLRAAFQAARSGVPGPVFVEIPIDILYPYGTVKKELMNMEFKGIVGSITKAFITRHIKQTYSGTAIDPSLPPLPVIIPIASSATVAAAARLVKHAKKPVLLIGSQATLEVSRISELVAAAKSLGIPTYVSGMARGLLGHQEELWFRQNRATALKNADVIILCGTVCDFRLKYGGSLSRKAKIIAVNRSSEDLHKNSDLLGGKWKPALSCLGDPLSFLVDLAKIVPRDTRANWQAWLQGMRADEERVELENAAKSLMPCQPGKSGSNPRLNPMAVAYAIDRVLTPQSILIGDGGDFVGTCSYILRPRGPLQWLDPGPFGTLGVGAAFAIAAKLARPSADVWLLWGDGSAGYSIMEYDTCLRFGIPFVSVIGNDACWTQIARDQIKTFGDDVACPLLYTDYDRVAAAIGCKGYKADTPAALAQHLASAKTDIAAGTAVCVNAIIGTTSFRDASISV